MEKPPIPREHGAWVMLYAPLVIAGAAVHPRDWEALVLAALASTGVFLAQHALALILKGSNRSRGVEAVAAGHSPGAARRSPIGGWFFRMGSHPAAPWLGLYLALAALGGVPLILAYQRWQLLLPAGVALGLWGVHSFLRIWPPRRRWDRTVWGEALGVTALGLTAPAAWVAAKGSLQAEAWVIWGACVLYFSSAIFHVRMILEAAKVKQPLTWNLRLRLARHNLLYHGLLLTVVAAGGVAVGGRPGLLGALAFAPGILRALYATAKLNTKLPPLKRLGLLETLYSCWFVVLLVFALNAGA
ncbi:MAG: YwiC-like family protein [Chthonomonadales bacterium]